MPFAARPERFAGSEWWRVYVDSNPRVLVRYRDYAVRIAELLAADEAQFRRDSRLGLDAQTDRSAPERGASERRRSERDSAPTEPEPAPDPEPRRSWRRQR